MARRRMEEIEPGETLLILATDPEAPVDIAAWAAREGHLYSELARQGWLELMVRKRQ